jgi:ABC-2 type transport system ATP-binding protein
MMAILQELQRMGKTIIISSHILSELQSLCNRVAIIEKGELIYSGSVTGVADQMNEEVSVWVKVASELDAALNILKVRPEVAEAEEVEGRIRLVMAPGLADISCVASALVEGGARLTELREDALDLEEVFLRVTKGETQ